MPNLFLGLTGSVASVKLPHLIREALKRDFDVKWSATASAEPFIMKAIRRLAMKTNDWLADNVSKEQRSPPLDIYSKTLSVCAEMGMRFAARGEQCEFIDDTYTAIGTLLHFWPQGMELPESLQLLQEIADRREVGQDVEGVESDEKGHVLHINTAEWADAVLIAPATANTLAALVHGITNNFVLDVARAMPAEKPVFIAPAMNTNMWCDPSTDRNLEILEEPRYAVKYRVIQPIVKELQCGTTGIGAMEEPDKIMEAVAAAL